MKIVNEKQHFIPVETAEIRVTIKDLKDIGNHSYCIHIQVAYLTLHKTDGFCRVQMLYQM